MRMRKVGEEDFDQIYRIYMDDTVNPYMSFPKMDQQNFREIFENFRNELSVYEKDGAIAAVVGVTILPYRSSHVCYIHKLAVNPEQQNSGIGSKLFAELISSLKEQGIKRVELKVEADNQKAISFYQKIGFQIEGTLRKYFNREGNMIDEHVMGMVF